MLIICRVIHAHHLFIRFLRDLQDSVLKYIEILDEGETPEVQRAYLESAAVRVRNFLVYQPTFLAAQLL